MEDLIKKCKVYFYLLASLSKSKIAWTNGYYLSSNEELNKLEKYFIKEVDGFSRHLIKRVKDDIDAKDAIYALSLLGWGSRSKELVGLQAEVLQSKKHELHNYYFRALFPILVSGKERISIELLVTLSRHRSPYCKNKALGILAYMPLSDRDAVIVCQLFNECTRYSKSPTMTIARPAKILLGRLEKLCTTTAAERRH